MALTRVTSPMIGYNGVTNITTNTTITDDIYMGGGQSFNVSAGATLTFAGSFNAGLYQVFTGAGEIKFAVGSVHRVCPEWWGAVNDGVQDCAPAINHAIRSGTLCNGIPVWFNSGGTYGLASPIFITSIGITLIGATPVYSIIGPLATDISVGGGSNAMIVNKVQPTNCKIQNIRFSENSVNFSGWCISGQVGLPGGENNFTSLYVRECWVALSAPASQGFFRGGFVDAHFEANQFEYAKGSCFKLGNAVGGYWLDNAISQFSFGTFIDATTTPTLLNTVKGLIAQQNSSDFLFRLADATKWHISDVTVQQDAYLPGTGLYTPGILELDTCSDIIFSNFTSTAVADQQKGIVINASSVIISNGQINAYPYGYANNYNPFNISGADNNIIIDNVNVVGNDLRGQITITAGASGYLRVSNSTFDKSALFFMTDTGAQSLNCEIYQNRITNCNYDGPSLAEVFYTNGSGYMRILNNVIGATDVLSTPVAIYRITGTSDLVEGGNTILGLGGGVEISVDPTVVPPAYVAANFNGTSFRSANVTPVGTFAPTFLGEMFYDTALNKWYKSYGTANTNWTALN
jgi:hypothetical protein